MPIKTNTSADDKIDFDVSLTSQYFDEDDVTHHCHDRIEEELSAKQKIVADVLHWSRNLRIGREVCTQYGLYPGPHGVIDKKRRWWPSPLEACDCPEGVYHAVKTRIKKLKDGRTTESFWYHPWSLYKHCASIQHCQYLAKYRIAYIYEKCNPWMDKFLKVVKSGDYPLLINSHDHDIIGKFVQDALKGKFDINKVY